jgi:hypothetical protein
MTAIGYVVREMTVTVDGATHACAVRGVTEVPTTTTVTTQVACPDGTKTDNGPVSWALTIDYNVSNLPGSLHRLLRDSVGAAAEIVVEPFPVDEPGTTITYQVRLTPAGGAYVVGSFGEASVTLPVTGAPVTTDPVVL